jgi:23S rRNA (pseudouridine1915-N3)-methyltransferase
VKLTVLCVGKGRERFVKDGLAKYLRFLNAYCDAEVRELGQENIRDLRDAPRIRKKEAERIFRALPADAFLIALDERGREYTSHEFAAFINGLLESGTREIAFAVGGAMGLDESVTGRAREVVALSGWTLTHEMARLVLLEQLYRAFTIIKGKTYHY